LPLSKYEIKAGWDIPATLEQAVNSDLPGEIKALVRSNVYDTATGHYLLIPQGARLVGTYNSRIAYGQRGVQVLWNRIIYPDGSSLDLGDRAGDGMTGTDTAGNAGFRSGVDNHYKRLIGFAALSSLFSAGVELGQNGGGGGGSVLQGPNAGQTVSAAVGQQLGELGVEITRRNLNIQPTIHIPIGYRFNVRVGRDILFDAPYRPVRM
jgi:type IV secretion system protein VirB10